MALSVNNSSIFVNNSSIFVTYKINELANKALKVLLQVNKLLIHITDKY